MASMEQIKNNLKTLNDKEIEVINSINSITGQEDQDIINGINTLSTSIENLSSIQSDWNVNDESDKAFIKNKPFYDDGETIKKIDLKFLPEELITKTAVDEKISAIFTLDGTTLTITTI